MRKRLFLTGPSGIGKSSDLQAALGSRMTQAGGLRTVRCRGNDGRPRFFALEDLRGNRLGTFLNLEQPHPFHPEIFQTGGAELLRRAVEFPFAVVDEIGGAELLIPEFATALSDFLRSGTPCIGVWKGEAAASMLMRRMGPDGAYDRAHRAFEEALRADPETLVLEYGSVPTEEIRRQIRRWVEEYTHEQPIF